MESHDYEIKVVWNNERRGIICSPELDGSLMPKGCIEVATPPEFPKGISGVWSPEHLFTASVASCLMTTFLAIAENSKLDFHSFECKALGKLEKTQNGFQMTRVSLEPEVVVSAEKDKERALKVLTKSEEHCLITHSVNSEVVMHPMVRVENEMELI